MFAMHTASGGAMEAETRVIPPILAGLVALAVVSAQAARSTTNEKWHPPGVELSFRLQDQACRPTPEAFSGARSYPLRCCGDAVLKAVWPAGY
jgi:hypothetical protein